MHPASQTQRQLGRENHLLSAPQKAEGLSLPEATSEAGWLWAPALTFSPTLETQKDLLILQAADCCCNLEAWRVNQCGESGAGEEARRK